MYGCVWFRVRLDVCLLAPRTKMPACFKRLIFTSMHTRRWDQSKLSCKQRHLRTAPLPRTLPLPPPSRPPRKNTLLLYLPSRALTWVAGQVGRGPVECLVSFTLEHWEPFREATFSTTVGSTEQMKDRGRCTQMAQAAGVTIGGQSTFECYQVTSSRQCSVNRQRTTGGSNDRVLGVGEDA